MRLAGTGQAAPTLRLWQDHNAVIIGSFQDAVQEVNPEACQQMGTAVGRRGCALRSSSLRQTGR